MKQSLRSDTALYGAAVMAERLIGLLLLPLLTRQLTNVEYGVWAQTAVASSVLMPLVLFGLPAAIVKFFAAGTGSGQRRRWMWRTLAVAGGLLGALGLAAWGGQAVVSVLVYGSVDEQGYVAVLAVVLAADALFDLLIAYLRADFRMRWIAVLLVSRGAVRLGFLLVALTLFDLPFLQVFGILALLQLSLVAIAFAVELGRSSAGGDGGDGATIVSWHAMLAFAAPLVMLGALTSINAFTDRFVLTHLLGLEAVAVYAAVSSVVGVASAAYAVLGFAMFPVLARQWAQGETQAAAGVARDAVRVFLFIALPFAFWLAAVSDTVLPLLLTPGYRMPAEAVLLLGIGVIGFGLYQIMLYLLLLAGKGMHTAGFMLLAALFNTALNLWLVPRLGITGAALAAALSNAVLAAVACRAAHHHAQARFPWASAARIALAACLAAATAAAAGRWAGLAGWTGVLLGLGLAGTVYMGADLLLGASILRAFVWRPTPSSATA